MAHGSNAGSEKLWPMTARATSAPKGHTILTFAFLCNTNIVSDLSGPDDDDGIVKIQRSTLMKIAEHGNYNRPFHD